MKTNTKINEILKTLQNAESLTEKFSQDKNGLLDFFASKNPQMKNVLPLLHGEKGNDFGSLLSAFQNQGGTSTEKNSDSNMQSLMSLLPLITSMKNKEKEKVASKLETTENFGLSPVARIATKEIVYAISYLLA